MILHSELIVLNLTKIKERSIVLHCLSREWGRRGFIVSAPKNSGTALFQPLSIIEAQVVENPLSDLWRLRNISPKYSLDSIRRSMSKNCMSMFMSEVLFRSLREGNTSDGLYEWCRGAILTLNSLDRDYPNYHLRFLLEFATAMGFSPSARALEPFSKDLEEKIDALVKADFASCMMIPLSGEMRNEIAERIIRYLEYHTGEKINLRSLPVLREIYRQDI